MQYYHLTAQELCDYIKYLIDIRKGIIYNSLNNRLKWLSINLRHDVTFIMRYVKYIFLLATLLLLGAFLSDSGMIALSELEDKRAFLLKENQDVSMDIESLERIVGKLRTDPRTVELAANRKLGMILYFHAKTGVVWQ